MNEAHATRLGVHILLSASASTGVPHRTHPVSKYQNRALKCAGGRLHVIQLRPRGVPVAAEIKDNLRPSC